MKISCILAPAMVLISTTALAQMSDAAYCSALTKAYETYVSNIQGRSPTAEVDAQNAIAQCKAGNTAVGIPVLEQRLRDAKVDLPKRS